MQRIKSSCYFYPKKSSLPILSVQLMTYSKLLIPVFFHISLTQVQKHFEDCEGLFRHYKETQKFPDKSFTTTCNRGSSHVFCRTDVANAKLTGEHLAMVSQLEHTGTLIGCNFKKKTPSQGFYCKFCKIFQGTLVLLYLSVATSGTDFKSSHRKGCTEKQFFVKLFENC